VVEREDRKEHQGQPHMAPPDVVSLACCL
jgi:hypothetical protein